MDYVQKRRRRGRSSKRTLSTTDGESTRISRSIWSGFRTPKRTENVSNNVMEEEERSETEETREYREDEDSDYETRSRNSRCQSSEREERDRSRSPSNRSISITTGDDPYKESRTLQLDQRSRKWIATVPTWALSPLSLQEGIKEIGGYEYYEISDIQPADPKCKCECDHYHVFIQYTNKVSYNKLPRQLIHKWRDNCSTRKDIWINRLRVQKQGDTIETAELRYRVYMAKHGENMLKGSKDPIVYQRKETQYLKFTEQAEPSCTTGKIKMTQTRLVLQEIMELIEQGEPKKN